MNMGGDRLREKCAVVGVSLNGTGNESVQLAYQALFALQHRGVEARVLLPPMVAR